MTGPKKSFFVSNNYQIHRKYLLCFNSHRIFSVKNCQKFGFDLVSNSVSIRTRNSSTKNLRLKDVIPEKHPSIRIFYQLDGVDFLCLFMIRFVNQALDHLSDDLYTSIGSVSEVYFHEFKPMNKQEEVQFQKDYFLNILAVYFRALNPIKISLRNKLGQTF